MRVLWITNIVFPEAETLLRGIGNLKDSGGWLLGAAKALTERNDIELTVAAVSSKVNKLTNMKGEKINYYLLPYGRGNRRVNHEYEPMWRKVQNDVNPEVVHIHGTEMTHGLAYIETCGSEHVCVSIQGLVSAYSSYYYYGLTLNEIRKSMTLSSIIHGGILKGVEDFKMRGESEKEIIRRAKHIIGRTAWDRARTWAINPEANYYYCGETLRNEFYGEEVWDYNICTPYSIFLSQAGYPIKGLHMVLKAMPIVLHHFPNTTLRIAGTNIANGKGWIGRLKLSNYGSIINKLIRTNNLDGKVLFTGPLDGASMKSEYLKSNVFICPSSIENSPNSLGEAQILGVPTLASYVGGVPDMMAGDESHLYRFEEIELLAYKICEIFKQQDKVETKDMRSEALQRHDPKKNVNDLIGIYSKVK